MRSRFLHNGICTSSIKRHYSSQLNTFRANDFCILRDRRKGQKFFIGPLKDEGKLFISKGVVSHKDIISKPPRSIINTHNGSTTLTAHFPTLDDYILNVKRACTPIYPKDASTIVRFLDLDPGAHVLEAGTGNGSLTLYLARAVAGSIDTMEGAKVQQGRVDTFDIRESHIRQAEQTVGNFARGVYGPTVKFHSGSPSSVLSDDLDSLYDGAVLDMPEPRHELGVVVQHLKNDRFLVCYLPNITQVVDLLSFIKKNNMPLAMDDCVDVMIQEWEVRSTLIRNPQNDGASQEPQDPVWICRPKNFDVKGHTAYLIKLRKCQNID
ncbi:hypothetical protein K450DRAFT_226060 [Umbelopsis ramanniana AG]|uniref:tRNA (adenine(58)-N(1))-methyltransferase catalytic subunit TRM61 n=1 Tax=Umbelopsis ramanniana AG TaxID=1314678 RepID=A0AAD5HHV0_UMBRA|nr:uncharacterized protein K450DRAFT_226060 [Umbelopsis ramanniana AG]KAI8582603.1 hypothetical protein K450DRAFT_226060 [Umbelopsis ramanniana AG]